MVAQQSLSPRAWGELFLLALIWGGSFLSIRVTLDSLGVLTSVAFRVGGAALVLWAYVLWRGLAIPRSPRIWAACLATGILNNVIPFSLITWGELHIPSGLAGILNGTTAFLGIAVAALVFPDERLTLRKIAGVTLGFLGAATVIGIEALARLDLTSLAQLAILGAALSYAFSAAFARYALRGLPPQMSSAGMVTGSSVVMIPLALLHDGVPGFAYPAQVWAAMAYLSLLSTAGAYLLYYRVLAMAGAGNLSLVTLLVAPIAILLGALILGEGLDARAYLGFALIVAGLVVIDGRLAAKIRSRRLPPAGIS